MEFDKSRVYTALNADELCAGSKCVFANSLGELQLFVQYCKDLETLTDVRDDFEEGRFVDDRGTQWLLAYLVSNPA